MSERREGKFRGDLFALGVVDQESSPPAEEVGAPPMDGDQEDIVASPLRNIGRSIFIRCELKQACMFIGSDGHESRLSRVPSHVEASTSSRLPTLS